MECIVGSLAMSHPTPIDHQRNHHLVDGVHDDDHEAYDGMNGGIQQDDHDHVSVKSNDGNGENCWSGYDGYCLRGDALWYVYEPLAYDVSAYDGDAWACDDGELVYDHGYGGYGDYGYGDHGYGCYGDYDHARENVRDYDHGGDACSCDDDGGADSDNDAIQYKQRHCETKIELNNPTQYTHLQLEHRTLVWLSKQGMEMEPMQHLHHRYMQHCRPKKLYHKNCPENVI